MKFTDSHCHIDFEEFDSSRKQILAHCFKLNIHRIVVPTISPDNWQKVLDLSLTETQECKLFPCLGVHPWFLNNLPEETLYDLANQIKKHREHIYAVGEAGIDLVIADKENNLDKQLTFFEKQLDLANEYELPVIVHHRRSHSEVLKCLKKVKVKKAGIVHAFSGSFQQACQYIDLGFKLGIGGTITYQRAEKTRKAIKRLPLSSLVLETDAPAMPLFGRQGEVNTPVNIRTVFEHLSELRNEEPEELAYALERNIEQALGLKK